MRQFWICTALVLALWSCGPTDTPETVLATFDGGDLTRGELDVYLAERPGASGRPAAGENATRWVEERLLELLTREVLVTTERTSALKGNPAFAKQMAGEQERALVNAYLATRQPEVNATPAEIDAFLAQAPPPESEEKRELYHIFLEFPPNASDESKQTVRTNAGRIRSRLQAGAEFREQAKAFSQGPTAEKGGYYGVAGRDDLPPALADLIFKLSEGELSEVLENQAGCHLFFVQRVLESGPSDDQRRDFAKRTIMSQKQIAWLRGHLQELLSTRGMVLPEWPRGADPSQNVLFSFGERSITLDMVRALTNDPRQFRDAFLQLSGNLVFSEVQQQSNPDESARILAAIERDLVLKQGLEESLTAYLATVPESDLRAFYEGKRTNFKSPVVVTMKAFTWTLDSSGQVEQTAADYAGALRSGKAPQVEPVGVNTIGPVAIPELLKRQPALANALPPKLENGQVVGPLKLGQSLLVLQVEALQEPRQLSFEEARQQVAAVYFQANQVEVFQAWTDELGSRHGLKIREKAVVATAKALEKNGVAGSSD